MESPYVTAWDNEKGIRIAYAHRTCAKPPRFLGHVSLNPKFDYGNRRCGICQQLLMEAVPAANAAPKREAAVRKPLAAASRPELSGGIGREADGVVFIVTRSSGSGYHAHAGCFLRSPDRALFRVVRTFANCGAVACHFCRQWQAVAQGG